MGEVATTRAGVSVYVNPTFTYLYITNRADQGEHPRKIGEVRYLRRADSVSVFNSSNHMR